MPEITVTHITVVAIALILGVIIGWIFRGNRSTSEKTAINVGWQEQLEAQRNEHKRLQDQNKSLMEQNSQFQASNKDSKMRAAELSDALKDAFERRDKLQGQVKDVRSNLELVIAQRDQLQSDIRNRDEQDNVTSTAIKLRDERISRLSRELESWQERVPPLLERFRARNEEAQQFEQDLDDARERIKALEEMLNSEQTHVAPVDPDEMTDGLAASNELIDIAEPAAINDDDSVENPSDELDDDLKKIKGVGPAIEKTLIEMGIRRFSQIAEMNEYDIDRIAKKLKGFRSRIYREDWIGQARDLHEQKLADQT
ncbi:MAG: hypothetical protein IIA07_01220 [Proteobacteria bacterium]|nr:hypothetical protein [Pseudomonadota bacterium]